MSEEYKSLSKIAKKRIEKRAYAEIDTIEDKKEKKEAIVRAIVHSIEKEIETEAEKLKKIGSEGKNVFEMEIKLSMLKNKIHYFRATASEEEYNKIIKKLKEIKKETENGII